MGVVSAYSLLLKVGYFHKMIQTTERPSRSVEDAEEISWSPIGVTVRASRYKSASYKWFSGGVASLPEGKSRFLGLVQLRTEYRLVSATSSPYH